jgi:hypothetical protein|tara:strand:+ start:1782 stop:2237 length:456 start_codon:yes stop_codon:yes gene_type:complete
MSNKKKFKDTTVGKMLLGAAGLINPTLGSVLQGVTSPKEAIAEIGKSKISNDDKIKLQQMLFEQQTKEMQEISTRWVADSKSDSWLSRNVRPMVLIFLVVSSVLMVFIDAGWIDFEISQSNQALLTTSLTVTLGAYFGGRSFEKITNGKKS